MKVTVTEDVVVPHPTREGAGFLVARKGQSVDEKVLAAHGVKDAPVAAKSGVVAADAPDAGYSDMKKKDLAKLVDERGLTPESENKQGLIDALEAADGEG